MKYHSSSSTIWFSYPYVSCCMMDANARRVQEDIALKFVIKIFDYIVYCTKIMSSRYEK